MSTFSALPVTARTFMRSLLVRCWLLTLAGFWPRCKHVLTSEDTMTTTPADDVDEPRFEPLHFDPEEYLPLLEGDDMSRDQKLILLESIWEVVVSVVDIAFHNSPIQAAEKLRRQK